MTAIARIGNARLAGFLLATGAAVLALFLFSFTIGPYPISAETVVSVFLHRLHLAEKTWTEAVDLVVLDVRGPRIAAALLVGGALACAGATYQNLFRNPLVSPGVLGVSAGAGFGAALGIVLGMPGFGVQGMAFLSGLAAVALTVWLGRTFDRHATLVLVVAGLVVSAFFQALVSLIKVVADPLNQLPTITFWLLGGLHRMSAAALLSALVPIGLAGFVLHALRWQVHALAAGEDEARSMGIDVKRVRLLLILAARLMTAACVSVAGIVGWVGLLIPHIVRMLVGPGFAAVLPMSALIGGGFQLGIDDLARAPGTTEIPLGIAHLAERPFLELSGGERQMVLVARALAQGSTILVLDEPCTSLDVGNQMRIIRIVRSLAREGYTILLTTHLPDHAFALGGQVALLKDGRLGGPAAPEALLNSADLGTLYGTPIEVIRVPTGPAGGQFLCVPVLRDE